MLCVCISDVYLCVLGICICVYVCAYVFVVYICVLVCVYLCICVYICFSFFIARTDFARGWHSSSRWLGISSSLHHTPLLSLSFEERQEKVPKYLWKNSSNVSHSCRIITSQIFCCLKMTKCKKGGFCGTKGAPLKLMNALYNFIVLVDEVKRVF